MKYNNAPCSQWWPLLSECADGVLDATASHHLRGHLDVCPDCAHLAQDLAALRGLLRGLPTRQTSPQFEARLAARVETLQSKQSLAARLGQWAAQWVYALRLAPTPLRPVLALGAAAAAVGIVAFQQSVSVTPQMPIGTATVQSVAAAADPSLVQRCVAQHRSDAAAQPLSDPAAQNLAARLDTAAPADPGEDAL